MYLTYSYNRTSTDLANWYMRVTDPSGNFATGEIQVAGPGYPQPATHQSGKMRYVNNALHERFLRIRPQRSIAPARITPTLTTGSPEPSTDLVPVELAPSTIKPGGVLEIMEKRNGTFKRLAFANDVAAGLTRKRSLTSLDSLTFNIAFDRFVTTAGAGVRSG